VAGPLISLLTDFGSRDPSAAICRGVILSIVPEARLLDISHDVAKFRIDHGALLLWCALPWLPVGTHLAVVDPGVGTERRPIALRTARGDVLVGPDNGLLIPAAERLGGIVTAALLTSPSARLAVVSSTFHGRDIFSPAAAHAALGTPLEDLGPAVQPADLVRLAWAPARSESGRLVAEVRYVDSFGNIKLGVEGTGLEATIGELRPGEPLELSGDATARLPWSDTFDRVPPGELLALTDSYGLVELAVNQGSAAERLGLREGMHVELRRA
jgi:S-adenosylmethionine hydrolase